MKQIVYVDSSYGSDSNAGDLDSPVRTLPYAYGLVYEGGIVVLQTGSGSTYGPLTLTKNITLKSAYGAIPVVGLLTLTEAQGLFEGLTFSDASSGIVVTNSNLGSVIVRECTFGNAVLGVTSPIVVNSAQYISIHRNRFTNFTTAITINTAQEVCISSNVFDAGVSGQRSIYVNTVGRLDLWQNTISGASSGVVTTVPNKNLRVIYKTLTAFDISYKRIQLPTVAYYSASSGNYVVAANVINDSSALYGTDFNMIASGSILNWDGLSNSQFLNLVAGDILRVMYDEGQELGGGEAIRIQNVGDANSRVDSNNITSRVIASLALGVYFNTPVKIGNNNFFGVSGAWWSGAIPTGVTGVANIAADPQYLDPATGDFHIRSTSPDRYTADSARWRNISTEMGVVSLSGHYTASVTGAVRSNVAPFDRAFDFDRYNRAATGIAGATGDIGALMYNRFVTSMGGYVSERGYDISSPGTATGPYSTIDRGFARAGSSGLQVATNQVPYQLGATGPYTGPSTGVGYGRYHSKTMTLGNSTLNVGRMTSKDVVFVYPSYPSYETGAIYVGSDRGTGATGSSLNPYRTISDALTYGVTGSKTLVIVKPGIYPAFKGVTGVRLIGVPETRTVSLGSQVFSSFYRGSYTGVGSYSNTASTMTLTNSVNLLSRFYFNADVDFRFMVGITGALGMTGTTTVGLTDGTSKVYAVLDNSGHQTIVGYGVSGATYEIGQAVGGTIPPAFTDVRVRMLLSGYNFTVTMSNDYISREYAGSITGGQWRLYLVTQGYTGAAVLSSLYLSASMITGSVTGIVSSTETRRKVFGIAGSTGMYQ